MWNNIDKLLKHYYHCGVSKTYKKLGIYNCDAKELTDIKEGDTGYQSDDKVLKTHDSMHMFANKTGFYKKMNDEIIEQIKEIGQQRGENNTIRIMDVGCGLGWLLIDLAQKLNVLKLPYNFAFYGIDERKCLIFEAGKLAKKRNVAIQFFCGDAARCLNEGSIDLIFSSGVLHHIRELDLSTFLQQTDNYSNDGMFHTDLYRHPIATPLVIIAHWTNKWLRAHPLTVLDGTASANRSYDIIEIWLYLIGLVSRNKDYQIVKVRFFTVPFFYAIIGKR